jgi:hypothetical protein
VSLPEVGHILFILPPWYRNISKRIVKSPKLYFPPIEIKAGETITSDYFIPDLPWGSGLIDGGLEPKARSDVRDERGETAPTFPKGVGTSGIGN